MTYLQYTFTTAGENIDAMMALLSEYTDDAIIETIDGLELYVTTAQAAAVESYLPELKALFDFTYTVDTVPDKNWNAEWEANFQPIVIEGFCCVRADFHPPVPNVQYDLIINPKMAFGTGHHETTYMMLQQMQDLDFKGKLVFDYGGGTGILAILAAQMGAAHIHTNDIELPSYENTLENAGINNVASAVTAYHGDLTVVPALPFEVILANINRNVIIQSLSALKARLRAGGILLISGFIRADAELMEEHLQQHGLQVTRKLERNAWLCWRVH